MIKVRRWRTGGGFSLVELLAVVGIMVLLMTLSIPAINSLTGSTGRKGAIRVMLNAFERARVAALESSTNSYIGFADQNFPKEKLRYRVFIIFRDRLDTDNPAAGATGATDYVVLSKWDELPGKISFKSNINSSLTGQGGTYLPLADDSIPQLSNGDSLPVISFNSTGSVASPSDSALLKLFLYQGFYAGGQDNFSSVDPGYFDMIGISRFTGRARLEISNPAL
jgi:type II secretory pathway pseudopilin PulG